MRKTPRVILWTVGIIAAVVGVLRATILSWWKIPGDDPVLSASIMPTLSPGDFVLMLRGQTPKFGDLVRCAHPRDPSRFVIGRILAEPGDTIVVENTDVIVNNRRSVTDMVCTHPKIQVPEPASGSPVELACAIEVNGDVKHMRAWRTSGPRIEHRATVSEGNVYLVSDDRAFPFDSRDYGAIPRSTCDRLIFFRLWGEKGFSDAETRLTFLR